jgi:hypothetical protein
MKLTDILSLFRQGKADAYSHLRNLIQLAAVDGDFSKPEQDLLLVIAKKNGISEKKLEEIRKNPDDVEFVCPVTEKEKFSQLFDLVHMMIVDARIDPEEVKLCDLFAIRFGYRAEIARELVKTLQLNIQNGSNLDETSKRVMFLLEQ